jgi:hypothetical protein
VRDLPIRTFLDLSTTHLREETCARLGSFEGMLAYKTEHGWWMYAPSSVDGLTERYDWPPELLPIIRLARSNDCAYVLFDADASAIDLLPVFHW